MAANKNRQGQRRAYPSSFGPRERKVVECAVNSANVDVFEEFRERPTFNAGVGYGDPTGNDGDVNVMKTEKNTFEYRLNGAATAVAPTWSATAGLDITLDSTDAEGVEYTMGIGARGKRTYVVGTDKGFFVEAILKPSDVSGLGELAVGFRKAEAYQALIDNYDEMACLNVQAGDVKIETILNNAATVTTDTTVDVADAGTVTLRVEVDNRGQCRFYVNGSQYSPSTQYRFDSAEVVVPFLHFLNASDVADDVFCTSFKVGSL